MNNKKRILKLLDLMQQLFNFINNSPEGFSGDMFFIKNKILEIIQYLNELKVLNDENKLLVKLKEVKQYYYSLYPPRDGLTDFCIWHPNGEERVKLNKPLRDVQKEINDILIQI